MNSLPDVVVRLFAEVIWETCVRGTGYLLAIGVRRLLGNQGDPPDRGAGLVGFFSWILVLCLIPFVGWPALRQYGRAQGG